MGRTPQASQKEYTMIDARDVMVPMRDGVHLAADIFRPDSKEKFPALLAMSPYSKGVQSLPLPRQPENSPVHHTPIEAGNPEYFASRGYVHVIADVRGTGQSEGEYLGWVSNQEAQDGYDLVEWIAAQPWCDGNVGMVGISYYGTVQLVVAAQQPPHLKAIMPWNAPADFYREATHHGGILQSFFHYLYVQRSGGENSKSVTLKALSKDEIKRLVAKLKADPDIQINPEYFTFLANPRKAPCFFDVLANPLDGPFYWERSPYTMYERIKTPFYARSGWWAYAHMHLVGAFRNYNGIDAPKKLEIDAPIVEPRPLPEEYNAEVLRWYDHWLKGINTGIMDEPNVRLFVQGADEWLTGDTFPLPQTKFIPFNLHENHSLCEIEPWPEAESASFDDFPTNRGSLKYYTAPIVENTEVAGPILLNLYASSRGTDMTLVITLSDVTQEGKETFLTHGYLKASHRELDIKKSKAWQAIYTHTNPKPLVPGQIYPLAINLNPTAFLLKAGHRLGLKISGADDEPDDLTKVKMNHLTSQTPSTVTVHHNAQHPSHLLLPITRGNIIGTYASGGDISLKSKEFMKLE